ncbi:unnamed protein product, partial [Prorocentrum cordatum]
MLSAEDPVEWLMEHSGGGGSASLNRPTAALLAEALAGKGAVAREDFVHSLSAVNGLTRESAASLVKRFGTRSALRDHLSEATDPVAEAGQLLPQLSRPACCRLVEAVLGQDGLALERHRQRIMAADGVSEASADSLAARFPDAASLCRALLSDESAPEPVGRAMALARLSRPAARGLVAEFLDGHAGLAWDDLVQRVGSTPGISPGTARTLVQRFSGDQAGLLRAAAAD